MSIVKYAVRTAADDDNVKWKSLSAKCKYFAVCPDRENFCPWKLLPLKYTKESKTV